MTQQLLLSPKFWVNVTVVCGIDCLACQGKFFMDNPLDVKENEEHVLDFALHLSHLFCGLVEFGLSMYVSCFFFSECLSNHCEGPCHTFSKICTKSDAVLLSDPS
jgi:hypothetical protein